MPDGGWEHRMVDWMKEPWLTEWLTELSIEWLTQWSPAYSTEWSTRCTRFPDNLTGIVSKQMRDSVNTDSPTQWFLIRVWFLTEYVKQWWRERRAEWRDWNVDWMVHWKSGKVPDSQWTDLRNVWLTVQPSSRLKQVRRPNWKGDKLFTGWRKHD